MRRFGRALVAVAVAVAALVAVPLVGAAQDSGSVTIEQEIDFTAGETGTFEVTEGADVLGCTSGTIAAPERRPLGTGLDEIVQTHTCESGPKTGTFTTVSVPDPSVEGPGDQNGPWEIEAGTGDFAGLTGGGDLSVVIEQEEADITVLATLTGTVEAGAAAEPTLANTGVESGMLSLFGITVVVAGVMILGLRRRVETNS